MTGDLTRLTVNLTPRASEELAEVARLTGVNRTDSVNRAILVYNFLEQQQHNGKRVALISEDGSVEIVVIL